MYKFSTKVDTKVTDVEGNELRSLKPDRHSNARQYFEGVFPLGVHIVNQCYLSKLAMFTRNT